MAQEKENENLPWIEKYRPNSFDEIVLDPINRQIFQNILKTRYFPNLLFYGPPGTGKTSTILNLIQDWNRNTKEQRRNQMKERVNIIHLNASDERGIDIIRNQISIFVQSKSLFEVGMKFVILDEVDYMTKPAQQAFKNLLQSFSSQTLNVRFCLICNYLSKIDESLSHEFVTVRFNQLPKQKIHEFIRTIGKSEGLGLTDHDIDVIQQMYKSDIRSMINFIQLNQNNMSLKANILTDEILKNFHEICFSVCGGVADTDLKLWEEHCIRIKRIFYEMTIQFNMNKKHILKNYLYWLIQKGYCIHVKNLIVIRNMVHYTEANAEQQLIYFLLHYEG